MARIKQINPAIISWARERLGLSVDDLAAEMGKATEEVQAWENGEQGIPYSALDALAYRHLRIPMAVFFFPEPPEIEDPVTKFRRLPEFELARLSADTRSKIDLAVAFQDSLAILVPDLSLELLGDVEILSGNLAAAAASVRKACGITLRDQQRFKGARDAFKAWRNGLERAGVFTFKDSFKDKFISGFSLTDDQYPVIMINNSNSFTRQIFTLMHELGHLLCGVNGISDVDESFVPQMSMRSRKIETRCNQFAAEMLLPEASFLKDIAGIDEDWIDLVSAIADRYCVSREVVLRRLLDFDLITSDTYSELAAAWNNEYLRNKDDASGGNYYLTKLSYLGEGFTRAAFTALDRGRLDTTSLAMHLNVKARNLGKLHAYLGA